MITVKSDRLWLQSKGGLLLLNLLPPDTRSCARVVHKTCVNTLSVLVQMVQCGAPLLLLPWWCCWRCCCCCCCCWWSLRWWSLRWLLSPVLALPPSSSREYGWNRLSCACKTFVQFVCSLLDFEKEELLPWWTMSITERSFSQQRKPAVAWSTMGLG